MNTDKSGIVVGNDVQAKTSTVDGMGGSVYPTLADLTYLVIGAAQKVSSKLGAGFLEKVYENALCWELKKLGLEVAQQCPVAVL